MTMRQIYVINRIFKVLIKIIRNKLCVAINKETKKTFSKLKVFFVCGPT